jgi:hypothetical protein
VARGSIYNLDQPLYSAANGAGGGRVPGITPGGQTRDFPDQDPIWSGTVPGQGPGYGQQQLGPGWTSGSNLSWDLAGGGIGWESPVLGGAMEDISNMSDLYDWYTEYSGSGGDDYEVGEYDDFYDWFNNFGWGDVGHIDWMSPYDMQTPGNWGGPGPAFGDYIGGSAGGGFGGGAIGGQGDLGTGNVFIGGGMASGVFGGEMSGQDCATLGPQFNTQGECISCCGEQYAGAGFYGTGEEYEGGGDYTIDPNMDTDCAGLYSQSGGYDFTNLSYSEFESMYC